ncbi:MAG TPA: glycosyltransferase [Candidatus Nanoarchaeia archaeon]|nr:glycosyltransferase [Candidatus Nanoarchaeia archaeon]
MKSISVILPTYEEKDNIKDMIQRIKRSAGNLKEIIVVDDNSPDLTWKLVSELAKRDKKIKLIRRIDERGIASAIGKGIKAATGDIIIWMDCDSTQPPELIPRLVERLDHYGLAIASRYVGIGSDKRTMTRIVTSKLFNIFASFVLWLPIKDTDSGFIAVNRKVFDAVPFPAYGYGEYFVEFIYKCHKKGIRMTEVGYEFRDRSRGRSKTADDIPTLLRYGWQYGIKVLKLRAGLI